MEQLRYYKRHKQEDKLRTEVAALSFLSSTPLRTRTPRLLGVRNDNAIELQLLLGRPPQRPTRELFYQIGQLAREIHAIGNWGAFGTLDGELHRAKPFTSFSDFIEAKIIKWELRILDRTELISRYINWSRKLLDQARADLDEVLPVFCHGDLDLKNILVTEGKITGLVDWEDSGIFCAEWELRKLSRWFENKNAMWESFINGYGGLLKNDPSVRLRLIKKLEAIDLLGHVGWCIENSHREEYKDTVDRMTRLLNVKGG